MDQSLTPLHQASTAFETLGLKVQFIKKNKDIPGEMAFSTLGMDEYEKAIPFHMQQETQTIEMDVNENSKNSVKKITFFFLSFIVTVPIQIPPDKADEILHLLAIANKSLPFGAFNYSDNEQAVYFRYTMPILDQAPSQESYVVILNGILFAKETFFSLIHEVAVGNETVTSLLEE